MHDSQESKWRSKWRRPYMARIWPWWEAVFDTNPFHGNRFWDRGSTPTIPLLGRWILWSCYLQRRRHRVHSHSGLYYTRYQYLKVVILNWGNIPRILTVRLYCINGTSVHNATLCESSFQIEILHHGLACFSWFWRDCRRRDSLYVWQWRIGVWRIPCRYRM